MQNPALNDALDDAERDAVSARIEAAAAERSEDATEVLRHLSNAAHAVAVALDIAVDEARAMGTSWQLIADALGLESRQAAHRRYGQ